MFTSLREGGRGGGGEGERGGGGEGGRESIETSFYVQLHVCTHTIPEQKMNKQNMSSRRVQGKWVCRCIEAPRIAGVWVCHDIRVDPPVGGTVHSTTLQLREEWEGEREGGREGGGRENERKNWRLHVHCTCTCTVHVHCSVHVLYM